MPDQPIDLPDQHPSRRRARVAAAALAMSAVAVASAVVPAPAVDARPAPAVRAAHAAPAKLVPVGWPNRRSTGASGELREISGREITKDGTVLENVLVHGQLTIRANNVVIRNVFVDSDEFYGILVYGSRALIERSTIRGTAGSTLAGLAATAGGSFVARRIEVTGTEDGVRLASNCVLRGSLVHQLAGTASSHYDSVTADGYTGWRIIHNTILNQHGQTASVWVGDPRYSPSAGVLRNNYIAGGGYSIYAGPGTKAGIRVIDNVFSTRYYPRSGYYGAVVEWSRSGNTWTGNRWIDGARQGRSVNP